MQMCWCEPDIQYLSLHSTQTLSDPIPRTWRKPAPRVRIPLRAAASSCGGITLSSLKPAARNWLELMIVGAGSCDVSTACAELYWVALTVE